MRISNKLCYYCGKPATTTEHAPPRMFFIAFECDSITVPSCDEHNTEKSGNDQAIVNSFLISLKESSKRYPLSANVIKTIEQTELKFHLTKRKTSSAKLIENPPEVLRALPNVSYLDKSAKYQSWIRQLTAALVCDANSKKINPTIDWKSSYSWSPDYIEAEEQRPLKINLILGIIIDNTRIKQQLDRLDWEEGWSAHPRRYPCDIYRFDLHFEEDEIIFRHTIYNSFKCYVEFVANTETIERLKEQKLKLANRKKCS